MAPREKGENRAGITLAVAEVEVISAGVVEVDGLLHQPQPKNAGVEIDVLLRIGGDGGNVVYSRNWIGHGSPPLNSGCVWGKLDSGQRDCKGDLRNIK